jgi:hypothetical protein
VSRAAALAVALALAGLAPALAHPAGPASPDHRCRCPAVAHECHCAHCRDAEQARRAAEPAQARAEPPCHRRAAPTGGPVHLPPSDDPTRCRMGGCGDPDPLTPAPPGHETFLPPRAAASGLPAAQADGPGPAASTAERAAAPPAPPPRRLA